MISLSGAAEALKKNRFSAVIVKNKEEALAEALNCVPEGSSIGFGGSKSVSEIGLMEVLTDMETEKKVKLFNPYADGLSRDEALSARHNGMTADVYVTSTNALTMKGELVNVDGVGNRVSAQIIGPEKVIIIAGKNKIVNTLSDAIIRVQTLAAPQNAMRLHRNTPCTKSGKCMDCSSEERICNVTTILHKSREKGRIHVILVDESLGL